MPTLNRSTQKYHTSHLVLWPIYLVAYGTHESSDARTAERIFPDESPTISYHCHASSFLALGMLVVGKREDEFGRFSIHIRS